MDAQAIFGLQFLLSLVVWKPLANVIKTFRFIVLNLVRIGFRLWPLTSALQRLRRKGPPVYRYSRSCRFQIEAPRASTLR